MKKFIIEIHFERGIYNGKYHYKPTYLKENNKITNTPSQARRFTLQSMAYQAFNKFNETSIYTSLYAKIHVVEWKDGKWILSDK